MGFQVVDYDRALIEGIVSVFNRETAGLPFVVPLTAELFSDQIVAKSLFDPRGCRIAVEGNRVIGFALACMVRSERVKPEITEGVIDGVFFPVGRTDAGHALIGACMEYLCERGAKTIWGFASHGGYPFWRGLYCGAEPVCLTTYVHGWAELLAHGFRHHQQSVNYLGQPGEMPYREDLDYGIEELDLSHPWAAESWRGHRPKTLVATRDGRRIGHVGFVQMPHLSCHRRTNVVGIYSFAVDATYRRAGIGSSLLAKLWETIADLNVQEVLVGTTVENLAARRTYEKAGMQVVAARSGVVWRAA